MLEELGGGAAQGRDVGGGQKVGEGVCLYSLAGREPLKSWSMNQV